MIEERNVQFQQFIETFKRLDNLEKKEEIIKSFKEFIAIIDAVSNADKIPLEYLHSNEVLDFNNNKSETDFLEAIFVYLEVTKDIIGQYLSKKENM